MLDNANLDTTHTHLPQLKFDEAGLIACVVQDAQTLEVLMVAWMNAASLALTVRTGQTWFWSRSRGELWNKGATSGNTQQVVELRYDCDGDTLLALVTPAGPACHTGATSCFYRKIDLREGEGEGEASEAALAGAAN